MRKVASALAAAIVLAASVPSARAEAPQVRIAMQYGFGFLPMMVMKERKLVEQQLERSGQGGVKVDWATLGGGAAMNDAVLSGNLDFATSGITPFITLWAKTRGDNAVKAVGSLGTLPLWLNTRNPAVHSLKDLGDEDRIAVTAVKISNHAILLQMAAEQLWGADNYTRLDRLTVTLSQPDGMAALLSNAGSVNAHFTAPPFQYQELKAAGVHRIVTSDDILGGPATFVVAWTTEKFRRDNPGIYKAFADALKQSLDYIVEQPPGTAQIYRASSGGRESDAEIIEMLKMPGTSFTITPQNVMKYAEFMNRVGLVKAKPASWTELFFPEVHSQPGS